MLSPPCWVSTWVSAYNTVHPAWSMATRFPLLCLLLCLWVAVEIFGTFMPVNYPQPHLTSTQLPSPTTQRRLLCGLCTYAGTSLGNTTRNPFWSVKQNTRSHSTTLLVLMLCGDTQQTRVPGILVAQLEPTHAHALLSYTLFIPVAIAKNQLCGVPWCLLWILRYVV